MMRILVAATAVLTLLSGWGCTGLVKGKRPLMELKVGGDWMAVEYGFGEKKKEGEDCPEGFVAQSPTYCCPNGMVEGPDGFCCEYRRFQSVFQGEKAGQLEVTVANAGEEALVIESIHLLEGGNPYISIKWISGYPDASAFPLTIEPDEAEATLKFLVVYDPDPGIVDVSYATLVVDSNHPAFENKVFNNEYRMLFLVESVGPKLQVDKSKVIFGCVSVCSLTPVTLDNTGTDSLVINKIDFTSPSAEFNLSNPPMLPVTIPKKGDPGYNSVVFSVEYCPADQFWDDTNTLRIETNDSSLPGSALDIPVTVQQAPAILEWTNDSPFGYLDFSGDNTLHAVNLYNTPASECDHMCAKAGSCCGCPIQIKSVTFDPKDSGDWYSFALKDPGSGQALGLPRALKGGGAVQFDISYQKPAGHPEDRNSTMCINYEAPMAGPQNYCLSLIAKNSCEFSLTPSAAWLHFNSSSPSEVKEKAIVAVNNGAAPCVLSKVRVEDKWPGESEDFDLKEAVADGTQIAPFSLLPIWVEFSPHSDHLEGRLKVTYENDLVGEVEESITLKGTKEQPCKLPTANAGEEYSGYSAGETVNLNGCGSAKGECGDAIFDNGYVWFLLAKPEGSSAQLSIEGTCMTYFTPDKAGEYEVALIAYTNSQPSYQSDIAIATIIVGE